MNPAFTQLEWDAFYYVSGEMSDSERESFENRLSDDQLAREAVARAVEFSSTLQMASRPEGPMSEPASPSRVVSRPLLTWNRRIVWISISALASLVLLFFTSGLFDQANLAKLALRRSSRSTSELAVAWAETRAHLPRVGDSERTDSLIGNDDVVEEDTDDMGHELEGNSLNLDSPMDPPSWMVTAVENLSEVPPTQGDHVE